MGFKTTNYEVKAMKHILPQAYAVVRKTVTDGERGYAIIGIHVSRELANNPSIKPLEEVRVDFKVNRDENDRVTAYRKAREPKESQDFNTETGKLETVIKPSIFADWEDDKMYY